MKEESSYLQFTLLFEEEPAADQKATALMVALEEQVPALWSEEENRLEGVIEANEQIAFLDRVKVDCNRLGFQIKEILFTLIEDSQEWLKQDQANLPPLLIHDIFIYGPDYDGIVAKDKLSLVIDSPAAFGSGHHPTTRSCIEVLQEFLRQKAVQRALDVGCGSGILSLVIAKLQPEAEVVACDHDPSCIEATKSNSHRNGLNNIKIGLSSDELFEQDLLPFEKAFDLIIANIHSNTLINLAAFFQKNLSTDGKLIVSGLLKEQGTELIETYQQMGFALYEEKELDGWLTLAFHKRQRERC